MEFKNGVIGSVKTINTFLSVLTSYSRTYTIIDVDKHTNAQSTFRKKYGSSISYADYYKEVYY